jgi:dCTP deaminase
MIYSDLDIKRAIHQGLVGIEPFNEAAVQPASLDLRLGNVFWSFKPPIDSCTVIDPTKDVKELMLKTESNVLLLEPQTFALGVTKEKVTLSQGVVARVEGKSSLGRLGLIVHATAGFIDPGFSGYITLEMFNLTPYAIVLRADMWIAQLAFMALSGVCQKPYGKERGSRYTDQDNPEPVTSRVHENVS